jgi:hypothetical protein
MSAEVITTFEARRRVKEMADVRGRFQAVVDAGGPLAEIAARWVQLLTVVEQQAHFAIKILEEIKADA